MKNTVLTIFVFMVMLLAYSPEEKPKKIVQCAKKCKMIDNLEE